MILSRTRGWCALVFHLMMGIVPVLAQESAPAQTESGTVQIVRTPHDTIVVISGVAAVDDKGRLIATGDFTGQLSRALENVRRLALRTGVLPSQIVTLTLYSTEKNPPENLEKIARQEFNDWNPSISFVESKPLRIPGALLEIEAVAVAKELKRR
jgi:enamine deaminase RidA (YjgF/YER057c/UK114 family)